MTDPITDAGLSLREDPSYSLMTLAEREEEARALLTTMGADASDPLNVALVLEEAAKPIPITPPPIPNRERLEGCGEKKTNCQATIAANGRCMDCGARRGVQAMTPIPPETAIEAPSPDLAPTPAETPRPVQAVQKPAMAVPSGGASPLLYRFKLITGFSEPVIAELIGKSRATVQAYISGRLPEILDDIAKERLRQAVASQEALLGKLKSELAE